MRFPSMPVRSGRDATLNFDKLQKLLTEREQSIGSAYRNAAQSVASGVITQVKLDKALDDPGNNLDLTNGYYVVPVHGYYLVSGQIAFEEFLPNTFSEVWVSGVKTARGTQANATLGSVVTAIVKVGSGEHIELRASQESGVEKKLLVGLTYLNRLNIVKVV